MADERQDMTLGRNGRVVQLRVVDKPSPDLPKLTKEKLAELRKETGGHIVSTVPTKRAAKQRERTRKLDLATFQEEFAEDKELVSWMTGASDKTAEDGREYVVKTNSGEKKTVRLLNPESFLRDMVMMKRHLADKSFQVHHYAELRKACEGRLRQLTGEEAKRLTGILEKLPPPVKLEPDVVDIQDVEEHIATLVGAILDFFGIRREPGPSTATPPATCSLEEGTGFGGDHGGTPTANDINPNGLLATNDWPLKPYTTCVRTQGRRGTCTAFGITAAAEARIAVESGRWMNLSEQDLYMHQKLHWFPIPPDWYGDGYNAVYSTILQTLALSYTFPFEADWDYNTATQRQSFDVQREYTDSCNLYSGEACSDTNHQAELIACYGIPETEILEEEVEVCGWDETPLSEQTGLAGSGWLGNAIGSALDALQDAAEWVCETVTEVTEIVTGFLELCVYDTDIAGTSGFRIDGSLPLWVKTFVNAGDWSVVKSHLDLFHPVVFCYSVVDSFGDNDGGYVSYDPNESIIGEDGERAGGHCVVITGYVDNADLPEGAPEGAGGGYFILKNSWGVDAGDQGYYYIPYEWTRRWGTAMIAVTSVSS